MENASKALLIAAATLIAIMIITVSIRIFNSTDNISDDAEAVGESIFFAGKDASKGAINALKDTSSKNLINVQDFTVTVTGQYYHSYFPKNPKVLLEPNTKYTLSFDYKIISADNVVSCGIGYGKSYYKKDMQYGVKYPNQKEGTFVKTFTTPSNFIEEPPYLQLRFARMPRAGNMQVMISNVRFEKAK